MANSYSDDIKVKISEKYKPPCKISMPMSYSQRLSLNKQLQDTRPSYDFHLEKSVLEKMKEWKKNRKDSAEERNQRLTEAREEFNLKIEKEKADKLEKDLADAKLLEESNRATTDSETATQSLYNNTTTAQPRHREYSSNQSNNSSQNQPENYFTKNGILMPIPLSNYSTSNTNNILKPTIPTVFEPTPPSNVKAFNLSDFENDTSSPFDNMELKSINDLEELAQVLKSDRAVNFQQQGNNMYTGTGMYQGQINYNTSATKTYGNLPPSTGYPQQQANSIHSSIAYGQNLQSSRGYNSQNVTQAPSSSSYNPIANSYSQVNNSSYNTPNPSTFSQYSNPYGPPSSYQQVSSGVSTYNTQLNGYPYNIPPQVTSQAQSSHSSSAYASYRHSSVMQPPLQKSNCKSVPDLVKSLEKELDSTRLNDTKVDPSSRHLTSSSYCTTGVPVPVRPKSTESVLYPKSKIMHGTLNPLDKLPRKQQDICRNVSVMGFPLDRVARVCEMVGCDQKKILDHLLALSELLDLGFAEKDASQALLKNDNDRDKALDLLIS